MSNPAEDRGLVPGTVVAGKLRVVRLLVTGGMGAVYEVEHELTQHHRALKILHPRVAGSPTIVARFLREASAAARIGNPYIAETFDAGRLESGEPYLLMELLDGETLDGRVSRMGPLGAGEVAELVYQACEGIIAAHDAGIVHRDLKPENLFVTPDGRVKILDFGLAKLTQEKHLSDPGSLAATDGDGEGMQGGVLGSPGAAVSLLTQPGVLLGTVSYMSPEQVRGRPADPRADLFAFGVILYEVLAGRRPFRAETNAEVMTAILHSEPAAFDPALEVPDAVDRVIRRCLEKSPAERIQSARDLAFQLQSLGSVTPALALPAPPVSEPPETHTVSLKAPRSGEVKRPSRTTNRPLGAAVMAAGLTVALGLVVGHPRCGAK